MERGLVFFWCGFDWGRFLSRPGWFGGLRRGEVGFGHGDVEGSIVELGLYLGHVAVVW